MIVVYHSTLQLLTDIHVIYTAIECPLLPAITNGLISYFPDVIPRFDLGTGANYTCDDGFYIDATEARMCMYGNGNDAMGVWSGQEPRCVGMLSAKAIS